MGLEDTLVIRVSLRTFYQTEMELVEPGAVAQHMAEVVVLQRLLTSEAVVDLEGE